jgi:ribonuclease HII
MPRPTWATLAQREQEFWKAGIRLAGVDEVGRGPLAGPVVACAVVLPPYRQFAGLDDSKRLTPHARENLYRALMAAGAVVGVGAVGPRQIDRLNIYQATKLAMTQALARLPLSPDWVLTDAMSLPLEIPCEALVGGDGRSASIAAASVIAKVLRDRYMLLVDRQWPGYGFAAHKGYASPAHWAALDELGPSPAHRQSFLVRYRERRAEAAGS